MERSSPIHSIPVQCWERMIERPPARPRRASRCRRRTPIGCSVTTISSCSEAVSIPALPTSRPARNWARSVRTLSSAVAEHFSDNPGQSGDPVSIGPVALRTTNQYSGLYALDIFDVTNAFSITGGGRFNYARITLEDQIGSALNGNETFNRFNPIIGGTYKFVPGLTGYAGYSEANRAPTPLALGCADPAHPCIIAAFLVSDPP